MTYREIASLIIVFLDLQTNWARTDAMNFAELKSKSYFVDKSELLKIFFESSSPYNLITSPRRFGKTSNLRMIETFCELELNSTGTVKHFADTRAYGLFNDTFINEQCPEIVSKHMSRYVVVYLDLTWDTNRGTRNFTEDVVIEIINDKLFECFVEGKYSQLFHTAEGDLIAKGIHEQGIEFMEKLKLRRLNETEVIHGLRYMAEILHKYFQADVTVLVDEYDNAMVPNALSKPREDVELLYIYINEMIITLVQSADNCNLSKVLVASTSNLAFGVSYPDLLDFHLHSFLDDHEFGQFFGFTYKDLDILMDRHNIQHPDERVDIQRYYCGYKNAADEPVTLCNPYSIARYFENMLQHPDQDPMKTYWILNQNDDMMLAELLNYAEFRQIASSLVTNNMVSFRRVDFKNPPTRMDFLNFLNFCKQKDVEYRQYTYGLFLNFVLGEGFLTYTTRRNVFVVPNSEIKDILTEGLFWYKTSSKEMLKDPAEFFKNSTEDH